VAAHEDKTNESMPTILSEALHVDRDMDNLELERDTPFAKDPREPPLQEPETPPHSSTSPHHTTVPPCAGPAKEQEENLEPAEEHNADTIVVDCAISDRGESLDDSEDEDYVEESLVVTKRRRVRFADTVRYAPDEPHQLPMSPADTLDNESQGSSSDVACIHEEMPVSGVLTLKEVDGTTQYSLIFSQDLLPHVLRQNSTGMRCSASPSVQGRGRVGRGKHMFSTKDDDKIIQMKEEGKSWDEIAEVISGSTKGSIQVRYSTKLKHRMGTRKRVSKRRRVE
jgi:hypothetical protein